MKPYSVQSVSEDSILLEWVLDTDLPGPDDAELIGALANSLLEQHADKVINIVPAYKTLLIQFDVLRTNVEELHILLEELVQQLSLNESMMAADTVHQIPTYYDASVAADLTVACEATGLSVEQLVEAHTSQTYTVYAIGFQPGFAYLGYVPEILAMPRHSSFRGKVPAGSVGIADRQTAVYPARSPGGWQIIGRTPIQLLKGHHSVLRAGDQVHFVAVDRHEYLSLGGSIEPTETR